MAGPGGQRGPGGPGGPRGGMGGKPKNTKQAIKRLFGYISADSWKIGIVLLCASSRGAVVGLGFACGGVDMPFFDPPCSHVAYLIGQHDQFLS